jgi:hypothetical protein
MEKLIGRKEEKAILQEILKSKSPEENPKSTLLLTRKSVIKLNDAIYYATGMNI